MNETLQAAIVTVAAAGALVVLVRSYLPSRSDRPAGSGPAKPSGCASCAAHETPQKR